MAKIARSLLVNAIETQRNLLEQVTDALMGTCDDDVDESDKYDLQELVQRLDKLVDALLKFNN